MLRAIHHFAADENLSFYRHRIPLSYSLPEEQEAAAYPVPSSLAECDSVEQPIRRDLTGVPCVTVDDVSTLDMDDALSFERTTDGYLLGIHISDVATIVPRNSTIDKESRGRATSVYVPDRTVHMLPLSLATDHASLKAGTVRPAVSCLIHLSDDLRIKSHEIVLSLIKVTKRLTYNDVDSAWDSDAATKLLLPFQTLYQFTVNCETERTANGASRIQKRDMQPVIDPDGGFHFEEVDEESPGRALVAELMVLANSLFAHYAVQNKLPLIFRGQEAADPSGDRAIAALPPGPAQDFAIRARLKRSVTSVAAQHHATLGLSAYAQVTSPIRRFADLVNQRQIISSLRGESPAYSTQDLLDIIASVEEPLAQAMSISKETRRYWYLKFLERRGAEGGTIEGTVVRNDLKVPLVEIDEIFATFPVRFEKVPSLGTRVKIKILSVYPRSDFLRLEACG